jgi:hypothetical protein
MIRSALAGACATGRSLGTGQRPGGAASLGHLCRGWRDIAIGFRPLHNWSRLPLGAVFSFVIFHLSSDSTSFSL